MSACPACDRPLVLPPAFAYIALKFPRIRASLDCDRTLPRCKDCDRVAAEKRAADAILPPPYYINPVAQIKKQIDLTQELIKAGVRREELEMELPALMKEGLLRLQNRDANIRSAWHEYWEIWGWQQGQPRH
ncbi:uncharacterized protein EAE98_009664 [Botrytis deweyae]|uniref:Uncharacterized protein n=1 Tax=Botrytis deweyae TaxID=2478750 RepID=A0ABQ7IB97_9HELO|nr:uncharacterized protein EAE98_009664 [Botrytis deweyae]KAF7918886.1 hypothetical protein EAE98_009664 [Botrytis deweyae]